MELSLVFDANSVIPVPSEFGQTPAAEWAHAASRGLVDAIGADERIRTDIETALIELAGAVVDDQQLALVIGAGGAVHAPLRIFVAPEMTAEEQGSFLWSHTALLPPTPRITESQAFGAGFSSTLAQREQGVDFATRRWLFFGQGATIGALLGPVAPYALAFVEEAAEAVLVASRLDGFVPVADASRVEELVAAVSRPGDEWDL